MAMMMVMMPAPKRRAQRHVRLWRPSQNTTTTAASAESLAASFAARAAALGASTCFASAFARSRRTCLCATRAQLEITFVLHANSRRGRPGLHSAPSATAARCTIANAWSTTRVQRASLSAFPLLWFCGLFCTTVLSPPPPPLAHSAWFCRCADFSLYYFCCARFLSLSLSLVCLVCRVNSTTFACPLHKCANCAFPQASTYPLVRCIRCPIAYHTCCVPAGCLREVRNVTLFLRSEG